MEFAYDGGGLGKGGTVTLYIDGEESARAASSRRRRCSSPRTRPATWATSSVRRSPPTTAARKFTGEVNWVEIDVGLDDHNHLITPEERLSFAMAVQ